jgi:hypothetical protein
MAKASKTVVETDTIEPEPVTESITYLPGPMDPPTVKWCGHTFQANVPKEITGHAAGSEREKLNAELIARARDNKHFQVGQGRARKDAASLPKTAEQYRAYMVSWLQDPNIEHVNDLIARFARDRDLQIACEVGGDDYTYLSTLFMPRLHELARADEMSEQQVAAAWVNHGIMQLPW